MTEKPYFTVDDIVNTTGAAKITIYNKIKEGKLNPINKEDRYMDGGNYLFTQEEFERAKKMFEKPGLTVSETAELIGESTQIVRNLFNQGVLKGIKKPYGGRNQIYIFEESIDEYLQSHDPSDQNVIYLKEKGYFLFQPVSVNQIQGRIIQLKKDGTGTIELESGEVMTLSDAEKSNLKPLVHTEDKDYIRKKGWVGFVFPKPRHINHIVFDIIVRLFVTVGPKNISLTDNLTGQISVKVKPCLVDINHQDEEVKVMQSHISEGRMVKHRQGIILISNITNITGEVTLTEKEAIKQLVRQGKYESIGEFVSEAIREKIRRETNL